MVENISAWFHNLGLYFVQLQHIGLRWIGMRTKLFCLLLDLILFLCGTFSHINIKTIQSEVLKLRDDVLKVSKFQNYVNENVTFKSHNLDAASSVRNISSIINNKFQDRIDAVKNLHISVKKMFSAEKPWGVWSDCCLLDKAKLFFNSNYESKVR